MVYGWYIYTDMVYKPKSTWYHLACVHDHISAGCARVRLHSCALGTRCGQDQLISQSQVIEWWLGRHDLYGPCMIHLPTFGWLIGQMLVNTPYMEHMGDTRPISEVRWQSHVPGWKIGMPYECVRHFAVNSHSFDYEMKQRLRLPWGCWQLFNVELIPSRNQTSEWTTMCDFRMISHDT